MRNLYTIYNQRLAGYLMLNGIPIIKIQKNCKTGKNDFIFPNTIELKNLMNKWLNCHTTKTEEHTIEKSRFSTAL